MLINHYRNYAEQDVISDLLVSLDVSRYESNVLLMLCLESQLIKPLVYICTHGTHPDFITPLMRMWANRPMPLVPEIITYVSHTLLNRGFGGVELEYE